MHRETFRQEPPFFFCFLVSHPVQLEFAYATNLELYTFLFMLLSTKHNDFCSLALCYFKIFALLVRIVLVWQAYLLIWQFDTLVAALPLSGEEAQLKRIAELQVNWIILTSSHFHLLCKRRLWHISELLMSVSLKEVGMDNLTLVI